MENIQISLDVRKQEDTAKTLRTAGFVPGVIYNHGKTDNIKVNGKIIRKILSSGVTESTLLKVTVDGKEDEAFIKDYQLHPVTEELLHIDFFRVTYGEKVKTNITIELEGSPAGVKEGGVIETFIHEVEVEIFPKYLTSSIKVDISPLNIGDSIHVEDINFPPETRILVEGNPIICMISEKQKIEEPTEAVDTATTDEVPKEEGEAK